MKIMLLPLIAIAFLAACRQEEAAPPPSSVDTPVAPVAKAEVPSLKGQWRLPAPASLDLTIRDAKATLSSGCMRRGFTFKQQGNSVAFASDPSGSIDCGSPTTVDQERAFAALANSNLALFGKDGSVTLSGFGGTLKLEPR